LDSIAIENSRISLQLKPDAEVSERLSVIGAVAWLCKAIRMPGSDHRFAVSSSSCRLVRYFFEDPVDSSKDPLKSEVKKFSLKICFSLQLQPLEELEHNCWQPLFESCIITESEESKESESFGKGLETSFELMTQLAAVEFPVLVNGGIILTGYQTALVPTRVEGNCAQFHLEITESGQINPYKLRTAGTALVQDCDQFKSMRCFVGWCETAHINLGTKNLTTKVKYSGGRIQKRTLRWNGISASAQVASATPLQAGLIGQANFAFVSNRLTFTPASVYSKLLKGTAKELAVIVDVEERRSWLVPKLSLLLHMSHVWVQDGIYGSSGDIDPIPYIDPHHDGGAVEKALKDFGDVTVCGRDQDSLKLRTLLLGLNINLLSSTEVNEESDNKNVFGFDFMDLVTEPGKGGFMKKIPIKASGRNWLGLIKNVDAIVVCSGIGQVITAADYWKCDRCRSLPIGLDYLAAPLSCLGLLTRRNGGELKDITETVRICISDNRSWALSGDPFARCTHDDKSEMTCWEGNIFQKIDREKHTFRIIKLWAEWTSTSNERVDLETAEQVSSSIQLSLTGAVVFGEKIKR
jgi:hypothetical protein